MKNTNIVSGLERRVAQFNSDMPILNIHDSIDEQLGELVLDGDGRLLHHNLSEEDYTKIQNILKETININDFSLKSKICSHKIMDGKVNHNGRQFDLSKIKEFE